MAEPRWLEVSLTVDPELGESVSEVLSRFVSGGVVVESAVRFNEEEDEGTPYGPVRVYGYLPVDAHIEETRQKVSEALWYLGRIQPLPEPVYKGIEDQDWMQAWKQHYHPIPIGRGLLILPAWIDPQPGEKRIPVRIDPSMAFGTGTHPTTQLCMELLEDTVRPGQPVIDVGCGSGILSIGALKLGASHALGVDVDNAAVISSKENAEANGVLERLEVGLGSVAEVRAGQFSLRSAPLVLANILAPVIIRLLDSGLADLVEPGGSLVLSGILDVQAEAVVAAAEARGLKKVDQRQMLDWVSIHLTQPV